MWSKSEGKYSKKIGNGEKESERISNVVTFSSLFATLVLFLIIALLYDVQSVSSICVLVCSFVRLFWMRKFENRKCWHLLLLCCCAVVVVPLVVAIRAFIHSSIHSCIHSLFFVLERLSCSLSFVVCCVAVCASDSACLYCLTVRLMEASTDLNKTRTHSRSSQTTNNSIFTLHRCLFHALTLNNHHAMHVIAHISHRIQHSGSNLSHYACNIHWFNAFLFVICVSNSCFNRSHSRLCHSISVYLDRSSLLFLLFQVLVLLVTHTHTHTHTQTHTQTHTHVHSLTFMHWHSTTMTPCIS